MSPVALNNDILLSILAVSPPKTATSIMATCHILYHEGAKIVLRDPVDLSGSEEKALALLRFVRAENLSRCAYVRILHFFVDAPPPGSVAKTLTMLVPRMTGLERLGFGGDAAFAPCPRPLQAFACLHSVKSLMVLKAGPQCCEMIRTLRSKLVAATIHFDPAQMPMLSLSAGAHPVVMLKRSATTLQNLSCGFLTNMNPELTFFPPKVSYPNLRTLALIDSLHPDPVPFIRAAPNVSRLSVENRMISPESEGGSLGMAIGRGPARDEPPAAGPGGRRQLRRGRRARAVEAHAGLHRARRRPLAARPRLPHPAPVPRRRPGRAPAEALAEALAHARPAHLQLSFRGHARLTDVLAAADVPGALRSHGASGVERLIVLLDLTADDRGLDVGPALDDLASAMSGLSLSHFQLRVNDVGLSEPDASASSPTRTRRQRRVGTRRPSLNVAERTLDGIDVHKYAKRLMGSIPTLNDAILRIDRPRRCGGSQRIAILGKGGDAVLCTDGEIVYEEIPKAEREHAIASAGFIA